MGFFYISLTIILLINLNYINALECYTGHSIFRGQSSGKKTEVCSKSTDQCFRAVANANAAVRIKLAGCSTLFGIDRCMGNKGGSCTKKISEYNLQICCCNTNLCNVKQKNGTKNIGGLLKKVGSLVNG